MGEGKQPDAWPMPSLPLKRCGTGGGRQPQKPFGRARVMGGGRGPNTHGQRGRRGLPPTSSPPRSSLRPVPYLASMKLAEIRRLNLSLSDKPLFLCARPCWTQGRTVDGRACRMRSTALCRRDVDARPCFTATLLRARGPQRGRAAVAPSSFARPRCFYRTDASTADVGRQSVTNSGADGADVGAEGVVRLGRSGRPSVPPWPPNLRLGFVARVPRSADNR